MRSLRMVSAALLAVALLVPMLAVAEEAPAKVKSGDEAVQKAFDEWQALEKANREAGEAYQEKVKAAKSDEEKKTLRDEFISSRKGTFRKAEAASHVFRDAFTKCDWTQWDAGKDADLLENGLTEAGQHLLGHDAKRAIEAFETLLKLLPKCESAPFVRSTWLPIALPSTGDFDAALKRCNELRKDVAADQLAAMDMAIGDIHAIKGDYAKAQEIYAAALASIPDDKELDKYDARRYARGYLKLRTKLIGKDAPEIDSKNWLGGEPNALSALKGNVVVVDFWATWCGPCTSGIPGMDELYKAHSKDGLKVLGVTKHYTNAFIPKDRDELAYNFKDGESLKCMGEDGKADEKASLAAITKFRDVVKPQYPFVIATQAEFEAYGITGIPSVFVVGKDGKIGFVAIGSGREALIKAAAQRLLKEKYTPAKAEDSKNTK
ncbi:MAG: redoxin domain-containing protein [Planctomycetes bacterium]|nr:redoxin domain-containing protein [Planctomycetota bacterium]